MSLPLRRALPVVTPCAAFALWALAALSPRPAHAQGAAEELARRDLIAQSEQASDRGEHPQALELATRAFRLRASPSLRLLLAQEHAALDHVLEALDQADACHREALVSEQLNQREAILEECRVVIDQMRARVSTLTVRAASGVGDDVQITLGDAPLDPALRGVAIARLPGVFALSAAHRGREYFRVELTLTAGGATEFTVPAPPPPPAPVRPPPTLVRAPAPTPHRPAPVASRSYAPWIVGASGLTLIGVGAALWWQRDLAVGACEVADDAIVCPSVNDLPRARTAVDWGAASNVAWVAGALTVGASAAWLLLRPRAANRAHLALIPEPQGLSLRGVF